MSVSLTPVTNSGLPDKPLVDDTEGCSGDLVQGPARHYGSVVLPQRGMTEYLRADHGGERSSEGRGRADEPSSSFFWRERRLLCGCFSSGAWQGHGCWNGRCPCICLGQVPLATKNHHSFPASQLPKPCPPVEVETIPRKMVRLCRNEDAWPRNVKNGGK